MPCPVNTSRSPKTSYRRAIGYQTHQNQERSISHHIVFAYHTTKLLPSFVLTVSHSDWPISVVLFMETWNQSKAEVSFGKVTNPGKLQPIGANPSHLQKSSDIQIRVDIAGSGRCARISVPAVAAERSHQCEPNYIFCSIYDTNWPRLDLLDCLLKAKISNHYSI